MILQEKQKELGMSISTKICVLRLSTYHKDSPLMPFWTQQRLRTKETTYILPWFKNLLLKLLNNHCLHWIWIQFWYCLKKINAKVYSCKARKACLFGNASHIQETRPTFRVNSVQTKSSTKCHYYILALFSTEKKLALRSRKQTTLFSYHFFLDK